MKNNRNLKAKCIKRSVGVHDGRFHADDVVAVALLAYVDLIDLDKVYRTRDQSILDTLEYVCDVGSVLDFNKKRFDHHQKEYEGNNASAGLVLKYLKVNKLISEENAEFLFNSFILGVDAHDLGKHTPCHKGTAVFSKIIESFYVFADNLTEYNIYEYFIDAVKFSIDYIARLIKKNEYIINISEPFLRKAISESKDNIVILDKHVEWMSSFFKMGKAADKVWFIIIPRTDNGGWSARCVPGKAGSFEVKIPLPESWGGLSDNDLTKASGIEGGIFCHKGLFISVWKTKDAAIKAAKKAIEEYKSV